MGGLGVGVWIRLGLGIGGGWDGAEMGGVDEEDAGREDGGCCG